MAKLWIEHFKGLLFDEATEDESEGMDEESCEKGEEEPSKEEIMQIISKAKNGKSPGKDGMSVELIKVFGSYLKEYCKQCRLHIDEETHM
ncbi:hypothetical protein QE152_g39165 [Popillia japonica]|uniref:Uncharacterized protein n=1 Tax=Popillia japonica TaxID=7064 RepID=A0AAW1HV99_POPJA